jgi:hypothetical protein
MIFAQSISNLFWQICKILPDVQNPGCGQHLPNQFGAFFPEEAVGCFAKNVDGSNACEQGHNFARKSKQNVRGALRYIQIHII